MEEPVSLSTEDEIVQSAQAPDAVAEPAALTVEQEVEMEPPAPTQVEMSAPVPDPALSDVRALKGILEALLFVTAEPIPVTRLLALLGAVTKQEVEQALTSLGQDYEQEGRGLQLAEVAGGTASSPKPSSLLGSSGWRRSRLLQSCPDPLWSLWRLSPTSSRLSVRRWSRFAALKPRE